MIHHRTPRVVPASVDGIAAMLPRGLALGTRELTQVRTGGAG